MTTQNSDNMFIPIQALKLYSNENFNYINISKLCF